MLNVLAASSLLPQCCQDVQHQCLQKECFVNQQYSHSYQQVKCLHDPCLSDQPPWHGHVNLFAEICRWPSYCCLLFKLVRDFRTPSWMKKKIFFNSETPSPLHDLVSLATLLLLAGFTEPERIHSTSASLGLIFIETFQPCHFIQNFLNCCST